MTKKLLTLSCTTISVLLLAYAGYELIHHFIELGSDSWKGVLLAAMLLGVLYIVRSRYVSQVEHGLLYGGSFVHTFIHSFALGVSFHEGTVFFVGMAAFFIVEESLRIWAMHITLDLSSRILISGSIIAFIAGVLVSFSGHDFGAYEYLNITFYIVLAVLITLHLRKHKH